MEFIGLQDMRLENGSTYIKTFLCVMNGIQNTDAFRGGQR